MQEKIRLVIWDLDETFWFGTLTESGYTYNQTAHDTVIELARRGIVSSICSKNDFETVKAILSQRGVWDYFIFPSISWESKGPRIREIVESVQLRAPTILFIDDNYLNLEEAKFFVPDLEVSAETIIPELLQHPLLQGKDDAGLTRLEQYKLMETRSADAVSASGGIEEFLRASEIYLSIEHDIEAHIDRAVELINRTNQLNFTKLRLPEDFDEACAQLRETLKKFSVQAGLIRVSDRYGDHGFCGFYAVHVDGSGRRLIHYTFSCRILNMGVERWVYERLGRPTLKVVGEVLTDLFARAPDLNWITYGDRKLPSVKKAFDRVFARGGCDFSATTHYFEASTHRVIGEFVLVRDGLNIRFDHSLLMRYAIEGVTDTKMAILEHLGYEPADFQTEVFTDSGPQSIRLFSFWGDAVFPVYRHKSSGLIIPFVIPGTVGAWDLIKAPAEAVKKFIRTHRAQSAFEYLRAEFETVESSVLSEIDVKHNIHLVLKSLPDTGFTLMLLPNTSTQGINPPAYALSRQRNLVTWTSDATVRRTDVQVVSIEKFVERPNERHDLNHFDRMVYFRLYEYIAALG